MLLKTWDMIKTGSVWNIPQVNRFTGNTWVSWWGTKRASLEFIHEQVILSCEWLSLLGMLCDVGITAVKDITTWAQEHLGKQLSVNTVCRYYKCYKCCPHLKKFIKIKMKRTSQIVISAKFKAMGVCLCPWHTHAPWHSKWVNLCKQTIKLFSLNIKYLVFLVNSLNIGTSLA